MKNQNAGFSKAHDTSSKNPGIYLLCLANY